MKNKSGPTPTGDKTPDPPTVEWLRWLIEKHNISQREAAEIVRVDHVSMRRWCGGTHKIPWAAAELLRIKLGGKK